MIEPMAWLEKKRAVNVPTQVPQDQPAPAQKKPILPPNQWLQQRRATPPPVTPEKKIPEHTVIKGPFGEDIKIPKAPTPEQLAESRERETERELNQAVKMQEAQDKYFSTKVYVPGDKVGESGTWVTRKESKDILTTPKQEASLLSQETLGQYSDIPGERAFQMAGEFAMDALIFPQRLVQQALVGVNPQTGKDWTDEELHSIFAETETAKRGVLRPGTMTFLWRISTDPLLLAAGVKPTFSVSKRILKLAKDKGWALTKANIPKFQAALREAYIPTAKRAAMGEATGFAQIRKEPALVSRLREMGLSSSTEEAKQLGKMYPGLIKKKGRSLDQAVRTLQDEGLIPVAMDEKEAMDYVTNELLRGKKPAGVTKIDWDALTSEEIARAGELQTQLGREPTIQELQQATKTTTSKTGKTAKGAEPWNMTVNEFIDSRQGGPFPVDAMSGKFLHKDIVRDAINEGKTIPQKVLKDYPELIQATKGVKPAATIGEIERIRQAETIKTAETGITTPGVAKGAIPPQKPPAPPVGPAGALPEDDFYRLLEEGKIAEAEAKLPQIESHLSRGTASEYLDDAKALTEGKPLPVKAEPKPLPFATGKERVSQINIKQFDLPAADEVRLAEKLELNKIRAETWDDTQAWLDAMGAEDLKIISRSQKTILPAKEFKAMVQLSSTNTKEIARLSEMLKFPKMRAEATKRIAALEGQLNNALAKASSTLTEAGRTLNLSKMIMKKTFNPDYWTIHARKVAGRNLSPKVIKRVTELSVAKDGDELAFLIGQLKKGLSDEAVLNTTLKDTLKAIREERIRVTYPSTADIDPKIELKKLASDLREEYGYPALVKRNLLNDIKVSQRLVDRERNIILEQALQQEYRTRKPAAWLAKAAQISGKPLTPDVTKSILLAVRKNDGRAFKEIIERLAPTTKWDKITDVLGIPRTIMASFDLSAPFRQGMVMVGRPEFWKSMGPMFKSAFSQKHYDALMDSIRSGSTYALKKNVRLGLTEMGVKLSAREEAFMSALAEKIPGIGRIIKGSNRAYSAFLNKLRSDVFDTLYQQAIDQGLLKGNILAHTKAPDKIIKDIARFINNATGRGDLGALNESMVILNNVFFSPRLMASRINMLNLNPTFYTSLHPFVRKQAVKDMLKFSGTALSMATMAKMAGADIELDPRSSDFGQIKVGNTRYDLWAGFRPYVVLVARMLPEFAGGGAIKGAVTGKKKKLGKGYKPATRFTLLENFFLNKQSPVASLVTAFLKQQDWQGKPINTSAEVINRFIPMVVQDMYDLYKEHGPLGLAMGAPAIFGAGVQTFGRKPRTDIGEDVTKLFKGKKREFRDAEGNLMSPGDWLRERNRQKKAQ